MAANPPTINVYGKLLKRLLKLVIINIYIIPCAYKHTCFETRHIELWDNFKSGWIGVSIDAFGDENEYIAAWKQLEKIEENLKMLNGLGSIGKNGSVV